MHHKQFLILSLRPSNAIYILRSFLTNGLGCVSSLGLSPTAELQQVSGTHRQKQDIKVQQMQQVSLGIKQVKVSPI